MITWQDDCWLSWFWFGWDYQQIPKTRPTPSPADKLILQSTWRTWRTSAVGIIWYHATSWHIMAYHGFRLQHSCSNPPGGGRDDGRIAAWAGGREIPGDSGRSFFRSWLQLVVVSVILGFVLLYWLTSVGVNIFKWNICETHTFICSIIYYI